MRASSGKSGSSLQELKKRLLFVLLGIVIFRVGAHIPVPGLDPVRLAEVFNQYRGGALGLFNMFSGGALSRQTLFALGVMPYISASIIMQLFSATIPTLEQLKKEGERGQRKITQYTRYGTLLLAMLQSLGIARFLIAENIALEHGALFYFVTMITLTTGTMFLLWLGEQMTEKGIGNGISLIIFVGIVSRFPEAVGLIFNQVKQGQMQPISLIFIMLCIVAITAFVVYVERAQRQIPINYPKRQQGKKMTAARTSVLPLKLNMAGVIPPIFASSVILFPTMITSMLGTSQGWPWLNEISFALSSGQPLHMILFVSAIVFFSFFYTGLQFNPKDIADNLRRSGALVPGMRPGPQTAKYIDKIVTRLTLIGAVYLTFVSMTPEVLIHTWHVPFYFGGTSLLIVVVVLMDFMAQVQAHLMSSKYGNMGNGKSSKGSGQLALLR